ncbi:twin-arginine translocase subunit TatB [Pistricoccus aurantiacus]|uniref:Sec-independent protein translocase protein TatB n=1 Tax=Pistricoccus aurantiacus TaxID=1883414 RepID=A0A5B8SVP3_9GAMM|nr:Sec-independent protein translocase protein TatB [Pistricoccus aurantiacus]QEA38808.1 twin-arginine translocase subunit TatB [Pistricoccus aurantiacus]
MFDIGFLELLIIGVVGLLVLGPERLPKAARTAGMWIGKIKRTVANMQREISSQLEAEELRQKLDAQQKKLDENLNKIKRDVEAYAEPESTRQAKSDPAPDLSADTATTTASDPPQKTPTISGAASDKALSDKENASR